MRFKLPRAPAQKRHIDAQLEAAWRRLSSIYSVDTVDRPIWRLRRSIERRAEREADTYLQPWLRLFEEEIGWLTTYFVGWEMAQGEHSDRSAEDDVPFRLAGAVVNYAAAVRRLARSGLDMPARVVLRTMSETGHLAIILLADRTLRRQYVDAQDADAARRVWRQSLTSRMVDERLVRIETTINVPFEAAGDFSAWRRATNAWLSEFVHPTYPVSVLASYAWDPTDRALENLRFNVLGRCCVGSRTTLGTAYRILWYFCVFFFALSSTGQCDSPIYKPDPDAPGGWTVIIGHDLLLASAEKWWNTADEEGYGDAG